MNHNPFNVPESLTVSQVLRVIETVDPTELLNELSENPFSTSDTDLQTPLVNNTSAQPQLQSSNVFLVPYAPEQNIFSGFDTFAIADEPNEQIQNTQTTSTYYSNATHIQDLKWFTLYAINNSPDLQITTNKLFNKNSANAEEGLCFYYNTKNTRLVFHLTLKLVQTDVNVPLSPKCIAKISLVKKRQNIAQPSDSIHHYVELLSARDSGKTNKLPAVTPQQKALTFVNGDDSVVLTLNQNLGASVDLTIWDVSSKHLFMKNGSGLKGCDSVGCQCDGAVKEMCFMVEVYSLTEDSQELSSLLLSKISEPFEIKSKMAKQKPKRTLSQVSSNAPDSPTSIHARTDININNNNFSNLAKKQKMQVVIPATNITSFKWKCKQLVDSPLPFPLGYQTCCTVSMPDTKSTQQSSYSILFGGRTVVSGLFGRNKNVSEQQLSVFVIIFDHQNDCFVSTDIMGDPSTPQVTPQGRSKHTCVAINNNNFLIFGGETLEGPMSDLYQLTVTKATQKFIAEFKKIVPNGGFPIPRFSHSAVLQQDLHQEGHYSMVIYGGETLEKKILEDVWILDFQFDIKSNQVRGCQWRQPPSFLQHPGPRCSHSAALLEDDGKNVMCVFGGAYRAIEDGVRMIKWRNDCWCLNLADWKWREIQYHSSTESRHAPRPRDGHVCLPINKTSFVLFGGWTGQMKMSKALQGLSTNNNNNTTPESVNQVINSKLMVGLNFLDDIEDAHFSNDLWIFDLATKLWTPLKVKGNASPSVGHSVGAWVSSVSHSPLLYLFGGETFPPKILNSVWKIYPKTL